MASPKMTVEFLPNGSQVIKFSSIDGISPGRIRRAEMQARRELSRLCGLAAGESRARKERAAAKALEAPEEQEAAVEST